MKSKNLLWFAIVCLLVSHIFLFFSQQEFLTKTNTCSSLLQILPERLRAFIAARIWEKADSLMHKGPIADGQNFIAGSYAGNTDIVPYLEMILLLCPKEVAPYRLLASNYAYHLEMKQKALNILEKAIKNCANSQFLHEICASYAFILFFTPESSNLEVRKKELDMAVNYIDKAINSFVNNELLADPVFTLKNYYIIKARLLWELSKPNQALDSWVKSGIKLEDSKDNLAKALYKFKKTGIFEKLENDNIKNKQEVDLQKQHFSHIHDHNHHNNSENIVHINNQNKDKDLLQTLIELMIKAGLIAVLTIILYFLGSRFCGIDSCVIQFSAGK